MLLCRHPECGRRCESDPDKYLETLVEEVLRLESPVQGLLRQTTEEVDLHGVTIAAGSVIKLGYGAGNRDERRYGCPAEVNLEREQPRTHLAFGVGAHHCLGAPLARRELYFGFKALVDRLQDIRFVEGANDFSYPPELLPAVVEGVAHRVHSRGLSDQGADLSFTRTDGPARGPSR